MYAFAVAVLAIGSMIALDEHLNPGLDTMTIPQAAAQSGPPPLSQSPFAPGQMIYLRDSIIDRITSQPPPFPPIANLETGNAARQAIVPYMAVWLHQEVTPHFSDPTLAFRYVTLSLNAGYDATAPYHETAVGVYSRIENRPASEYENNYTNMNIASMYASYQLFMAFDSDRKPYWDKMLTTYDLDPNDRRGLDLECTQKHTLESPVAIGNLAGKCVIEGRMNDGFNHFGNETNGYPFMDTTGYKPVNSANELVNPSKWQPLILRMGEGQYVTQQFVTPQWANTMPYSDLDPRTIRADPPARSDHTNMTAYKAQADEVLEAISNLDDYQKILAEYFDNKARGTIFSPPLKVIENPRDFWALDFLLHFAEFDAGIVAWQEKARHDAVRPETAIKYIYGDELVPTFGKEGNNTKMVPASQWEPYLYTSNHPEYPSATACFCAAEAQAWKRYLGGDDTIPEVNGKPGFSGILRQGSSIHETGMTPASDIFIKYDTWTDYVRECGDSRVWTGVHFQDAIEESIDICTAIGDKAYEYFQTLLDGTAPQRGPDTKLAADIPSVPSMPLVRLSAIAGDWDGDGDDDTGTVRTESGQQLFTLTANGAAHDHVFTGTIVDAANYRPGTLTHIVGDWDGDGDDDPGAVGITHGGLQHFVLSTGGYDRDVVFAGAIGDSSHYRPGTLTHIVGDWDGDGDDDPGSVGILESGQQFFTLVANGSVDNPVFAGAIGDTSHYRPGTLTHIVGDWDGDGDDDPGSVGILESGQQFFALVANGPAYYAVFTGLVGDTNDLPTG